MPSDFDIIVRGKDTSEVRLICETKMQRREAQTAELQLKNAMARLSCPLGLLFTPEILRIYSDRYTSDVPADSIELLGEFDSRPLLRLKLSPRAERGLEAQEFENAVQQWLESLPETFSPDTISDARLAGILATFIVPAVASGQVSAAAPRYF
jgi:hypothetical protein